MILLTAFLLIGSGAVLMVRRSGLIVAITRRPARASSDVRQAHLTGGPASRTAGQAGQPPPVVRDWTALDEIQMTRFLRDSAP